MLTVKDPDIYDLLKREIELYNHFQRIISVFPQKLIQRQQIVKILYDLIRLESKFDLPSLTQNSKLMFENMLHMTHTGIHPGIIIPKIIEIKLQYDATAETTMGFEPILLSQSLDGYIISLEFNYMSFIFEVPTVLIECIRSHMGRSKHIPKFILMYALRLDLFQIPFKWGLFRDLDQLCDYFAVKKTKSRSLTSPPPLIDRVR